MVNEIKKSHRAMRWDWLIGCLIIINLCSLVAAAAEMFSCLRWFNQICNEQRQGWCENKEKSAEICSR